MNWFVTRPNTLMCLETGACISFLRDGNSPPEWTHWPSPTANDHCKINGPAALAKLGYRWNGKGIVPVADTDGDHLAAHMKALAQLEAKTPNLVPVDLSVPVAEKGTYAVQFAKSSRHDDAGSGWFMAKGEPWDDHTAHKAVYHVIAAWRIVWPTKKEKSK